MIHLIFQIDPIRTALILTLQPILGLFFLYLAYKVLKRRTTRVSLTLSAFYILNGIATMINAILIPLKSNETSLIHNILYYINGFLVLYGFIFILIFLHNLLKFKSIFSFKNYLWVILFYAVFCIIVLTCIPESIIIDESTNWIPIYSWLFLIVIYSFFTIIITIPTITYSIRLYKKFEDPRLKTKLKRFIIGIVGMLIVFYGVTLYNTWHVFLFRTIWSILVFFITIPSAFLIFYGIGYNIN